ncbi:hypothetical protein Bca52824_019783 [Brassica carinata]|uniref:BAH domain-containing protein n=1 Tax=Brassica carinata TaxID=52824 RepID=A0A8X7VSN3_BRACI|nr:hypothetical protein Bca52824_019783 [Brassica carinata]
MEKKSDGLPFKWGKRRGPCVENEDVQYYESFTYGGCEYRLYDCVSVGDDGRLDSPRVFFVGKIIKMWEYTDQRQDPRRVELLWFFKPSELSVYLEGVGDVLANELFLASGSGVGLTNENLLEAISGKCRVLCISKDVRNPQPSEEEIKSADFLFHRTYDVGNSKILDTIDDNIAGVDVKFIFNRTSSERKANALQIVATDLQGTADSLKPYDPSSSGSVMQNARNASDLSSHKQLAKKKSTLAEERPNKGSSGRVDGELDSFSASGSRRNDRHGRKDQDDEVRKQLAKQNSRLADERYSKDSYCSDDMLQKKRRLDGSPQKIRRNDGRKDTEPIRRDAMVGKSRLAEERRSNDFYGLDVMPLKTEARWFCCSIRWKEKRVVNGSAVVSDGRSKMSQKLSHDGRKDPRDNVTRGEVYSKKPSFTDKNQDMRIPRCSEGKETRHVRFAEGTETRHVRFSEGQDTRHVRSSEGKETRPATEKGLIKKSSPDCKISKHSEEKSLTNADYRRHDRVFEVTQKPNVVSLYSNVSWEEDLRCAEGKGTLVVLRNLDPSYTSHEVENIIYSALNEQCTARTIERTSATIPHIGEALVIFETMDAAKRVIRRLHEGCLLLPNGRVLVATSAKVNPPAMPSLPFLAISIFSVEGRYICIHRSTAVTSHCCQGNNIEFEMGMEWWLHLSTYKQFWRWIYERQIEETKELQLDVQPKHT